MIFGFDHYVPILKVKRGEKRSLKLLATRLRSRITPLLEIVEHKTDEKTLTEHLDTSFDALAESVGAYPRVFIDVLELAPGGPPAALAVFERATAAGFEFTPVTGIRATPIQTLLLVIEPTVSLCASPGLNTNRAT